MFPRLPAPLALSLTLCLVASAAPQISQTNSWEEPAMTKEKFLDFTARVLEMHLKALDPAKSAALRKKLKEMEAGLRDPVDRVSVGTQISGVLEGLGFHDEASIYAEWAVLQKPESKVAVANVAALGCFPPILKLAIELDSNNPVVHTNFASCAASAKENARAKAGYEKALQLKPGHANALLGLASLAMREGDFKRAFALYAKANGVHFMPGATKGLRDAKGQLPPPPRLIEPTANRFGGGAASQPAPEDVGSSHVTDNKLELPPLQISGSPDAFIAGKQARRKLAAFYAERMGGGLKFAFGMAKSDPFKEVRELQAKVKSMTREEKDAFGVQLATHPKWNDEEASLALELNTAWLSERLDRANAEYDKATAKWKAIGKEMTAVAEAQNKRVKAACDGAETAPAIAECLKNARPTVIGSCKQTMQLNAMLFTTYRDAYLRWYEQVKPDLEETYRVQGLWIRQLANPTLWQTSVMARNMLIFTPLAMRMVEEDTMRLVLFGVGASAFGKSAEVCPKEPPPEAEKPEEPKLPQDDNPKSNCGIDDKKPIKIPPFDIPGVPFGFEVTCTEATFNLKRGVGGEDSGVEAVLSIKYRFGTDKTTTVYLGVEAGLSKGALVPVEVKGELGMSVTFSRQGELIDVGGKAGVTESVKLPGDAWSGSIGATAAIEKGAPSVDFSSSSQVRQLPF